MHADIFCRVIDNFGDIGVTWRLVRQLQQEHQWSIRLWVDDLNSFHRIEPRLSPTRSEQHVAEVEIIHWTDPAPDLMPHPIVVASFSCELPQGYIARMHEQDCLWINLEYLSAEPWVEGCHGLPSLRSDGLTAHFFFPGFNTRTGGLLRERSLLAQRDAWRADPAQGARLMASLGVPELPQSSLISLFCYPQAPIASLIDVLSARESPTVLLVPHGVVPDLQPGIYGKHGHLHIVRIPFVSQDDFDRILWSCDVNIVRGEDSVMRALWAGKPFIWHIYPQSEQTHLKKLESWLAISGLSPNSQKLLMKWNEDAPQTELNTMLNTALSPAAVAQWGHECESLSQKLALNLDLASALNQFCQEKQKS